MKKVLLTSVAALAVVASAAPAFADNNLTKGNGEEKIPYAYHTGSEDNSKEATFGELQKDRVRVEGERSEDWTKGDAKANANAGGKAGTVVKVDKGEAAKTPAKPEAKAPVAKTPVGNKALPKTSAVK